MFKISFSCSLRLLLILCLFADKIDSTTYEQKSNREDESLFNEMASAFEGTSLQFDTTSEEYEGLTCIYTETSDGYACQISNSIVTTQTQVTEINGEAPDQTVTYVRAHDSHLEFIPEIVFDQFQDLTKIDLNNVGMLLLNPLQNCLALTYLNLEDNEIRDVNGKTFEKCPNLKEIYLSGNGIRYMPSDALDGLDKLEILHVRNSDQKIVASDYWRFYLNAAAFRYLTSLVELEMSMIRPIDFVISLQAATNLEFLRLDLNQILQIIDETFKDLWKVKELNLSQNEISTISENAFISLTMLTNLDLSDNKLSTFPAALHSLKVIAIINLDKNEIGFLNQLWEAPMIETFSIANNRIQSINVRFFTSSIKSLKLSGNICVDEDFIDIQDFELEVKPELKNCFDHFVKETFCIFHEANFGYSCKLILDHETNEEIDETERFHLGDKTDADVKHIFLKFKPLTVGLSIIFEKFNNLEKIELWQTSIEVLAPFESCSQAQTIDFRFNSVANLVDDTFRSCPHILSLTLMKNEIISVEENAFAGLTKINYLDLSFNGITEIPEGLFDEMIELKTLKLSHNQLASIDGIASLPSLESLYLSFNEIEFANFDYLKSSSSLKEIHLNDNKIYEIQSQVEFFLNLVFLNVENNNLSIFNIDPNHFPKLQYLDVSNNGIYSIISDLKAFRYLADFYAIANLCVNDSFENIENFDEEVSPQIETC